MTDGRVVRRWPLPLAACGAATALLIGACGNSGGLSGRTTATSSRTEDTASVEAGITDQLSTAQAKVTGVKCPAEVAAAVGTSFTCSVTWSNGASGKVEVTKTRINHYTYEPVTGTVQVPGATVEQSLEQELAAQGAPDAAVNCPDTIIVKLDTTVTCDLGSAGGHASGTVTYTFSSTDGTVDPSSVQTG
jgi:Domain of unknown function (DUF4333)